MTLDPLGVLDVLSKGGIIGLFIVIGYAGAKKAPTWVWGWVYRDVVADRDEWKAIALRGTSIAARATEVAVKRARDDA